MESASPPTRPQITTERKPLRGLVAATYTPMDDKGAVLFDRIGPMVEHLVTIGVEGLFPCGSTGEGLSLTTEEREQVTETLISANAGRLPVAVHVGHNSVRDACRLAAHAESHAADAIASIAPGFYKPNSAAELVSFLHEIALAASATPLFYYHFPARVSTNIALEEILELGLGISNFAGVKYTHNDFDELGKCRERYAGRYDLLFGRDELFLKSLQHGFVDFVGSTYNHAIPIFLALRQAFEAGDDAECLRLQGVVDELLDLIISVPAFSGQKFLMEASGFDCGPSRCPLPRLDAATAARARRRFDAILASVASPPAPSEPRLAKV